MNELVKNIVAANRRIKAVEDGVVTGDASAGDLYLEIEFSPYPTYHVEDKDVYLKLPVTFSEVALDATIKAPTPTGSVDLKIPAISASGRKLRLKARGIPAKPLISILQLSSHLHQVEISRICGRILTRLVPAWTTDITRRGLCSINP